MPQITSASLIKSRVESMDYWKSELTLVRTNQKALTAATKFLNAIIARHPEIAPYAWTRVNTWNTAEPVTLCLSTIHEVTSMKVGIIPAFMRSLLEAGFDAVKTSDQTSKGAANRTFEFKRPAKPGILPIEFSFTAKLVDAPDATCRKVQTGTEIKEVPTYQLVCEE